MKQRDENKMLSLYNQWLASGQSKKGFSAAHGLRSGTFHYWVKKFQNKTAVPAVPVAGGGFDRLPIEGNALGAKTHALAIVNFPTGISVEFYSPLDAGLLNH